MSIQGIRKNAGVVTKKDSALCRRDCVISAPLG
jgi:hypothetical protein